MSGESVTQPLINEHSGLPPSLPCKNCPDRLAWDEDQFCCKTCARTSGHVHGPFCEWQQQQQQRQKQQEQHQQQAGADQEDEPDENFRDAPRRTFWKGEEVHGHEALKQMMNKTIQDDTLHIIFVDAMYLHKALFEFDEGDCREKIREATMGLNAMAYGLFVQDTNSTEGNKQCVYGEQDELTEFMSWGCLQLLAADTEYFEDVTEETTNGNLTYQKYPFNPQKRKRFTSFARLQHIWTMPNFVDIIPNLLDRLGPHRRMKFLSAMCVQVPTDLLCWKEFNYFVPTCPVKLAKGLWRTDLPISDSDLPRDVAAVNPTLPAWNVWFAQRHRSRVIVFYTEVQGILCQWQDIFRAGRYCSPNLQVVKFVKAVSAASDDHSNAQSYSLPFTQAVAESLWDLVWPFFCWNRVMDVIFQVLLSFYVTPASHNILVDFHNLSSNSTTATNSSRDPFYHSVNIETLHGDWPYLCILVYLGSRTMLLTLMELFSLALLYGKSNMSQFVNYWNSYRVVNLCIDAYAFWIMCLLTRDFIVRSYDKDSPSVISEYPFRLTGLVFSRWCQSMLMFMNTYALRETMLPAWNAVVGKTSMAFLVVLVALSSGTAVSYYALPVGETAQDTTWHWQEYLHPFFVMSRLNMMGDISSDISGDMDTPENNVEHFKWALSFFIIFCGVLFPVVSLNLYVGVLSAAYAKEVQSLIHAEGLLHSTTACRLLLALRWYPLRRIMAPWTRVYLSVWSREARSADKRGTWIAIPEHRFNRDFDADHINISDTLSIMRVKLEDPDQENEPFVASAEAVLRLQEAQRTGDILKAIEVLHNGMEEMRAEFGGRMKSTDASIKQVQEAIGKLQKQHNEFEELQQNMNSTQTGLGSRMEGTDITIKQVQEAMSNLQKQHDEFEKLQKSMNNMQAEFGTRMERTDASIKQVQEAMNKSEKQHVD